MTTTKPSRAQTQTQSLHKTDRHNAAKTMVPFTTTIAATTTRRVDRVNAKSLNNKPLCLLHALEASRCQAKQSSMRSDAAPRGQRLLHPNGRQERSHLRATQPHGSWRPHTTSTVSRIVFIHFAAYLLANSGICRHSTSCRPSNGQYAKRSGQNAATKVRTLCPLVWRLAGRSQRRQRRTSSDVSGASRRQASLTIEMGFCPEYHDAWRPQAISISSSSSPSSLSFPALWLQHMRKFGISSMHNHHPTIISVSHPTQPLRAARMMATRSRATPPLQAAR